MSKQAKVTQLKPRDAKDGTQLTRKAVLAIWNAFGAIVEMIRAEARKPIGERNAELAQPHVKFMFGLSSNQALLRGQIEALQECSKPVPGLTAYNEKRIALCKEWATRDDKGEPMIDEHKQFVIADQEAFDAAHEELKAEHKADFDAQEARNKELDDLLDEEVNVVLRPIAAIHAPRGLLPEHWSALQPVFFDDEN